MENEFVPYRIAKAMQEKGFDEVCFLYWRREMDGSMQLFNHTSNYISDAVGSQNSDNAPWVDCTAPLWQQAIDWICKEIGTQIVNYSPDRQVMIIQIDKALSLM